MGRNGGNSRNGTRTKTVMTEIGPVDIEVPRDREGTFKPTIVRNAPAPPGWCRWDRALAVCPRADHRGDRGALRRGVWRSIVIGFVESGTPSGIVTQTRLALLDGLLRVAD